MSKIEEKQASKQAKMDMEGTKECPMSKTKERHAGYGLVSPKKCDIMCLTRSSLACKGELRKATTKSEDFGVGMCLTRSSLACKGELRKVMNEKEECKKYEIHKNARHRQRLRIR